MWFVANIAPRACYEWGTHLKQTVSECAKQLPGSRVLTSLVSHVGKEKMEQGSVFSNGHTCTLVLDGSHGTPSYYHNDSLHLHSPVLVLHVNVHRACMNPGTEAEAQSDLVAGSNPICFALVLWVLLSPHLMITRHRWVLYMQVCVLSTVPWQGF